MHMYQTTVESLRISLPILTPQTTIFGFNNGITNSAYKVTNHILLIFKLHVYKSRER